MTPILGIVTIGQTPRPDLAEAFGAEAPHVEVRVAGALDGILPDELAALRNPGTSASPDFDYPLLVRAMAPLLGERVRLVIVGEGIVRADIEAAITPAIRDFVILTGARRDVSRVLCAFDVYASSSRAEGLPLALAEAMATRLPIVATAVGGVPDIVPPQIGVLVPHGDPQALRAPIQRLIDDPGARSSMGEAARQYALGRFAEERMLDRYLALYASPHRRIASPPRPRVRASQ